MRLEKKREKNNKRRRKDSRGVREKRR